MDNKIEISIIIPIHNGKQVIRKCLNGINASSHPNCEVLVVDDASTDESTEICRQFNVKIFRITKQSGPGAARNLGSKKAKGEILFFVDSDVVIQPDTIEKVLKTFNSNLEISALFGSYDADPEEQDFFSQYRNLCHHFIHQHGNPEASTFWAGCGAIRKNIFDELGGFDEKKYPKPSIEDIELGYRLKKKGFMIKLAKEIQVKHLKRWTFKNLIQTDIVDRAIPWSKLIEEEGQFVKDLNLKTSDRISAGLAGISILILPICLGNPNYLIYIILLSGVLITLNLELYLFFLKRKGLLFTLLAFPMQLMYYLYSSGTYIAVWATSRLKPRR